MPIPESEKFCPEEPVLSETLTVFVFLWFF